MKLLPLDPRVLIAGCAVVALAVGFLMPRPTGFAVHEAAANATVPPQLTRSDLVLPSVDATPTASSATVDVCGAVRRPGVLEFAPGARVIDALNRAGGPLSDADLDQVNLAQPLVDAMKLCVPRKGQVAVGDVALASDASAAYQPARHHRRSSHGRSSHKLSPGQTLDVNTASVQELTQLPGVGPGLAQRIVDFRAQNGPFQTVDDLQNVPGLGPSKFDRLEPYVRL